MWEVIGTAATLLAPLTGGCFSYFVHHNPLKPEPTSCIAETLANHRRAISRNPLCRGAGERHRRRKASNDQAAERWIYSDCLRPGGGGYREAFLASLALAAAAALSPLSALIAPDAVRHWAVPVAMYGSVVLAGLSVATWLWATIRLIRAARRPRTRHLYLTALDDLLASHGYSGDGHSFRDDPEAS